MAENSVDHSSNVVMKVHLAGQYQHLNQEDGSGTVL
jgi:hypothetical protein